MRKDFKLYAGGVEMYEDLRLQPEVALGLINKAKFVGLVQSSIEVKLWFIPFEDVVAVVMEKREQNSDEAIYYSFWVSGSDFRSYLRYYYYHPKSGFTIPQYDLFVYELKAVRYGWTEAELEEAKKWCKVNILYYSFLRLPWYKRIYYKLVKAKIERFHEKGITKGYYLLPPCGA